MDLLSAFNGMKVGMGGAKALAHSAWHVPWLPEKQTAFIDVKP